MNKRILTTILIIVSMIGMTACNGGSGKAKDNISYATPAEHILAASANTFNFNKMGIESKISFEGEFDKIIKKLAEKQKTEIPAEQEKYIKFANAVIKDLTIDYNYFMEFDKTKLNLNLYTEQTLNHDKQKLMTVQQYNNNLDTYRYKIPNVSQTVFQMSMTELLGGNSDASEEYKKLIDSYKKAFTNINKIDTKPYVDILCDGKDFQKFIDEDLAGYKKIFLDAINSKTTKTDKAVQVERDGKKINTTEYKSSFTFAEMFDLYSKLIAEVKKDPDFSKKALTKWEKVVEHFKKSEDYKLFDIKVEDIDEYLAKIKKVQNDETYKQFTENIEKLEAEIEKTKNMPELKIMNDVKVNLSNRINEDNKIDSLNFIIEVKPLEDVNPIKIKADLVYKTDFTMPTLEDKNIIKISELIKAASEKKTAEYVEQHPELIELMNSVKKDVSTFISDSDTKKYIIDLMNKNGLEKEAKQLDQQIQMAKAVLQLVNVEEMLKDQK